MTLNDLKSGEKAIITGVSQEIFGIERLKELGLISGTEIKVIRYSPFNDLVMIYVRGSSLCIRLKDAKKIRVVKFEKDMSNR